MKSVIFDSLTRVLRRYEGTLNCDNTPVEEVLISNCTQVGARRYSLEALSEHFTVSNYHPFKIKYGEAAGCTGNITELWSYDGCFNRRKSLCQGPNEYRETVYA